MYPFGLHLPRKHALENLQQLVSYSVVSTHACRLHSLSMHRFCHIHVPKGQVHMMQKLTWTGPAVLTTSTQMHDAITPMLHAHALLADALVCQLCVADRRGVLVSS